MSGSDTAGWRRYNIFLSSTFKDMDFERDIIKFHVIPALNRRFRDKRVELQAIDLRLGVNTSDMTEEESERKVLSVCTSCIDSARPFFIGLLGERYGWIPPVERWREFLGGLSDDDRQLLAHTAGCSVTEMEIVYGALSQGNFDSSHVLFYLRDDTSYNGIPEDLRSLFCDTDPAMKKKLADLKARVTDLFSHRAGEDDRCTSYHLDWEDGHFRSDEFEKHVTEQLALQIELETARRETEGTDTWWKKEKELEESTLLRLLTGSVEYGLALAHGAKDDNSSDKIIWYTPGLGASTQMAQAYSNRGGDEDVIRLLAVFGLSEYSRSMRPVMARWIYELAAFIGKQDLPDDDQLLYRMSEYDLYSLFESVVTQVREQHRYIYIYMDEVETLEMTSPRDLYMYWLQRVKDDVNIQINLQDESEARKKFLEINTHLSPREVILLDETDTEELISSYEKTYFLELPAKIRQQMLDTAKNDEILAPVKVHNMFRLFESLTQEDFATIRQKEGSQIDAINGYLEDIWEKMPDDPYDLTMFMLDSITHNLGLGDYWRYGIATLCAAPSGLREQDIAHFVDEEWDEVQFYRVMNFLQDFFYEDPGQHLWRSRYIGWEDEGLQDIQLDLSDYIITLDPKDSLRETMGLYYALKGGEPSHFTHYMLDDYLHSIMIADQKRYQEPQLRQLMREDYFEGDAFKEYCLALEPSERLQLMMQITTSLEQNSQEQVSLKKRMAEWLDDIETDKLSADDAFTAAGILCIKETIPNLEWSLDLARRAMALGQPDARRLISALSGLLTTAYLKKGKKEKAQALADEIVSLGAATPKERFVALHPLAAQASDRGLFSNRKKADQALERLIREYYALADSMGQDYESLNTQLKSSMIIISAFMIFAKEKRYQRLLEELIRYLDTIVLFSNRFSDYLSNPSTLQKLLVYYSLLFEATTHLDRKEKGVCKELMGELFLYSCEILCEVYSRLNDINPEDPFVAAYRSKMLNMISGLKKELEYEKVDIKETNNLILDCYKEYVSKKN
jgi:hypothetical protein